MGVGGAVDGRRLPDPRRRSRGFAEAGRILQGGGQNIQGAGAQLGDALERRARWWARASTTWRPAPSQTAGEPFIYVGQELESLLLFIARLLGAARRRGHARAVADPLPAVARRRLATVRAAHKAIRRRRPMCPRRRCSGRWPTRALNRLSYQELLEHTSDPFGDFAAGRYGRLARAELASVGLR